MIDNILFTRFQTSVESQGAFRIIFAFFITAFGMMKVPAAMITSVDPNFLLRPAGLFEYVPTPSFPILMILHYVLVACTLLLLIGFYTKTSSLLLCIISIYAAALQFSLGKVDHHILFLIVSGCMFFSRWGEAYSMDSLLREKKVIHKSLGDGWPFGFLAMCLAYGMFTSGLQKVMGGWLMTSSQATVGWMTFIAEAWGRPSFVYSNINFLIPLGTIAIESMDWFPVLFDLTFPIALLNKKLFRTFCCLAVIFHIGTWLLVDIYFPTQTLVYAAFFDWHRIVALISRERKKIPIVLRYFGGFLVAVIIVSFWKGVPYRMPMFALLAGFLAIAWLINEHLFSVLNFSSSKAA